jgi:DNA-binding GntR family transcriptional regulator
VLAEQFGVSRNTAVRALAMLRDEGLIVTHRGWGSFVAGEPRG